MESRHRPLPLIAAEAEGAGFLILRPAWSIQFQDNQEYIEPVSKSDWQSQGKSHSSEVPEFDQEDMCCQQLLLPHAGAHQTGLADHLGTLLQFLGGG